MNAYIDRITQSLARMSQRERLLVIGLAAALVVLIMALFSYLILDGLGTRRARNERLQQVIERLDKNRDRLMAGRSEDARLDVKLDRKPPALQAHLDTLAKRLEVEVKDYKPAKDKVLGERKKVLEKAVTISIYNIELDKFMKFVNAIESGGHLIMITELQVVPRSTDHGMLDVKKMKVSSYERNLSKSSGKGKKQKGKSRKNARRKG